MNIYDKIKNTIYDEWQSGATQQEIADRANVTNQYINHLLSGKRKVESMKLETLFKLFPKAEIFLNGAQIAGDNAIQIQGGVNTKDQLAAVLDRIMDSDTLTPEEKIKVYQVLKK